MIKRHLILLCVYLFRAAVDDISLHGTLKDLLQVTLIYFDAILDILFASFTVLMTVHNLLF